MTREVRIDFTSTVPKVYVNGVQTSCAVDMTFHHGGGLKGGLNVVAVHLRRIPEAASANRG